MTEKMYREPLNQFLSLGRPTVHEWPDYITLYNLTAEHVPDLLRMLEDYSQPVEEEFVEPEGWAAVYAWRSLGQLKDESTIEPLIKVMLRDVWEDWGWEELPEALAYFGELVIEPLERELSARAHDYSLHCTLVQRALEVVAEQHSELQDRIVSIFISRLEHYATNDIDLNAFLICSLAKWQIRDALPLIEKAYAEDAVSWMICGNWDDIQVDFGLKDARELEKERKSGKHPSYIQHDSALKGRQFPDFSALWDNDDPLQPPKLTSEQKKKKKKRKEAKKSRQRNRKKRR